jgi:hypothetical protein
VLTVDRAGVSYSESRNRRTAFHLSCGDFLSGASVTQDQAGSALVVPVRWDEPKLRPEPLDGITSEDLLRRIKAECKSPGAGNDLVFSDGSLYRFAAAVDINKTHPGYTNGILAVRKFEISYIDSETSRSVSLPCSEIATIRTLKAWPYDPFLIIRGQYLQSREKGLNSIVILQGIKDACHAEEAGYAIYQKEEDQDGNPS